MFSWKIYEFLKTSEAATEGVLSKKGLQRYKKETSTQVFSCEYCKIFKNAYFEERLWKTAY